MQDLFDFINASPTAYHAVEGIAALLAEVGFIQLREDEPWSLVPGGAYYVTRNGSSILAFTLPDEQPTALHIVAAHSDSPCFKLKENATTTASGYYKLSAEKYGGMLLSTWLDRPLSVAGRLVVKGETGLESKLVNLDYDAAIIPNLAIHLNKEANKGIEYNPQVDLQAIIALEHESEEEMDPLLSALAAQAGVKVDNILGKDLFLYNRDQAKYLGIPDASGQQDFFVAPRIDNLECSYAAAKALVSADRTQGSSYIKLCAIFDNEEVGSGTRQGADSTFLRDCVKRIAAGLGVEGEDYRCMLARSFCISADNGHAIHPNHPEKTEAENAPKLNGGIVIKFNGSQHYATDAYTGAYVKDLCKRAGLSYQTYNNRADIPGGHTLGNISTAQLSIPTADIGLAQLAMHSALETAGAKDFDALCKLFQKFYAVD